MRLVFSFLIIVLFCENLIGQNSLELGQIACYPINGSPNDYTGNGNHGGPHDAILVPDRFDRPNSAYQFDGIKSYIELNTRQLKLDNYSVSLWAKANNGSSGSNKQYLWTVGSTNGSQNIFITNNTLIVSSSLTDSTEVVCEFSNAFIGKWTHIVAVRETNTLLLYIDGKMVCNKTNVGGFPYYGNKIPHADFGIGQLGRNTFYNGILDDIHVYDRPLSPTEIRLLFEGEKRPEIKLAVSNYNPCGGDGVLFSITGASESANFVWKFNDFSKQTYFDKYDFLTDVTNKDFEVNVTVEIIDDETCFPQKPIKTKDKILVKVCSELVNLKVPNIFTPNGDGINDTWEIPNLNRIPEATIIVYDRRGTRVFFSKGYDIPWDGTVSGHFMASETYDYVIATNIKGEKSIKGAVMVVR